MHLLVNAVLGSGSDSRRQILAGAASSHACRPVITAYWDGGSSAQSSIAGPPSILHAVHPGCLFPPTVNQQGPVKARSSLTHTHTHSHTLTHTRSWTRETCAQVKAKLPQMSSSNPCLHAQGAVACQGPVLGTLQGYMMARRQQPWEGAGLQQPSFQGTALCHLALSIAWKKATLLYRRLALCMAAHAVKVRLCSGELSRGAWGCQG